ncbi:MULTISPECIES: LptE family protein [unclassified Siphonobacter]|uniref:LptE family protein n=1 Tax=unclassified Siphonobacter TaxID=2635712 RepID=UPI001E5E1E04|nr:MULTISPECIES: LptE family protein [unclassified Siphonobacter]MDQ1088529.1 hypothetical protein [Siphonobacter sp. SORGH_AS_1065]MDR6194676.1 hypothetical protein [Siphonobacter sp. SORGH_AS_0500]
MKSTKSKSFRSLIMVLLIPVLFSGCGPYSFSPGGKLSSDLKTITINNFVMNAAGGPATLPTTFTESLKEYFQRNTRLQLRPEGDGDLVLEGAITNYEVTPQAPTAQDKAGLNRLNITVTVRFTNNKDESSNFEQPFSFFRDFPQNQSLNQVEAQLIPPILDQIILDIFSKTAGDW